MPSIPIIMPQLGESIAEATVVNLLVPVGDHVETDQDIIEVETSKATMNVASPCPGRVERFLVKPGESYPVGAVLGYLEASAEDAARLGLDALAARQETEKKPAEGASASSSQTEEARKTRPADGARSARPGECRRRQLHVPAHEGAHGGTGPPRGGPGGPPGQRRRRTRDHPGLREVHCQP